MSNLEDHEREQAELTAEYEARFAPFDPGEAKAPKAFYVTLTWDDWPEGGSYGTVVQADNEAQAEKMAKLEMANCRAEGGDAEFDDSDPLYWLEAYADSDWHVVDCFEMAVFIANHTGEKQAIHDLYRSADDLVADLRAQLVTRSAPRWAWEVIDETLTLDSESGAFDGQLRRQIQLALRAMYLATERADDEPIREDDPMLEEDGE